MNNNTIVVPKDKIPDFYHRSKIKKSSLFGSILREDFSLDSDVDILVAFEENAYLSHKILTTRELVYST